MTENDRGSAASDSTSIFAGGLFNTAEPETSEEVLGVDGLSSGSALLVVKRGPNAGSRFQLDREKAVTGLIAGGAVGLATAVLLVLLLRLAVVWVATRRGP